MGGVLPQVAWDWGWGSACLCPQVQPTGLLPCPQLLAWTTLCPQAGRPLLTVPCCTPLSGCSWPGRSQALTGLFRSEERVRAERKGEGTGGRGQAGSWEQQSGPPGAAASPLPPAPNQGPRMPPRGTSSSFPVLLLRGSRHPFQPKLYLIRCQHVHVGEGPTLSSPSPSSPRTSSPRAVPPKLKSKPHPLAPHCPLSLQAPSSLSYLLSDHRPQPQTL